MLMRKLGIVLVTAVALQALFAGSASAKYLSGGDLRLNLSTGTNLLDSAGILGQTTFNLQESLHQTLSDSTGLEVDHSYIWIGVDGTDILAIDPPQAMY